MTTNNTDELQNIYTIVRDLLIFNPELLGNDQTELHEIAKSKYELAEQKLEELFTPSFNIDQINEVKELIKFIYAPINSNTILPFMQQCWFHYILEIVNGEVVETSNISKYVLTEKDNNIEQMQRVSSIIKNDVLKSANQKLKLASKAIDDLEKGYISPIMEALKSVHTDNTINGEYVCNYYNNELANIIFEIKMELRINKANALNKLLRYMDTPYDIPNIDSFSNNTDQIKEVKTKRLTKRRYPNK